MVMRDEPRDAIRSSLLSCSDADVSLDDVRDAVEAESFDSLSVSTGIYNEFDSINKPLL